MIGRSLLIWLILIAAEVVHGMLRAIVLVPVTGEFRSNQIGVFTGAAIILFISSLSVRWIGANRTGQRLMVGAIWTLLTVAFELLFGHFVLGLSWERICADYNMTQGGLMPLGLLILFFSPQISAKLYS